MSDQPPYPPNQPGWGQQPPQGPPSQQPGWGQQPPPPPPGGGWGGPPPGGPPPGGGWGGPPPGPANFEASAAIGYGWKGFTTYAGPLLVVSLMTLLAPSVVQWVGALAVGAGQAFEFQANTSSGFSYEFSGAGLLFQLLSSLVGLLLSAVLIRLALDVVDGNEVTFGSGFTRLNFVHVIIASVVLSILTTIGIVLCVLPGLVVMFLSWLTLYFVVGKGEDAFTAIKSSVQLTVANFGQILLLAVLSVGCIILGVLACCVGLIVAYPVITVAAAYTFRALQSEPVRPL